MGWSTSNPPRGFTPTGLEHLANRAHLGLFHRTTKTNATPLPWRVIALSISHAPDPAQSKVLPSSKKNSWPAAPFPSKTWRKSLRKFAAPSSDRAALHKEEPKLINSEKAVPISEFLVSASLHRALYRGIGGSSHPEADAVRRIIGGVELEIVRFRIEFVVSPGSSP